MIYLLMCLAFYRVLLGIWPIWAEAILWEALDRISPCLSPFAVLSLDEMAWMVMV
jgi:hypothetical protein